MAWRQVLAAPAALARKQRALVDAVVVAVRSAFFATVSDRATFAAGEPTVQPSSLAPVAVGNAEGCWRMIGLRILAMAPCWLDSDSAGFQCQAERTCSKVAPLRAWALRAAVAALEVLASAAHGWKSHPAASVLVASVEGCFHSAADLLDS